MDENNNSPPSPSTMSIMGIEQTQTTPQISLGEEELLQLVWRMKDPKSGLVIKDRKKSLKTYKASFIGRELIDWLLEKGIAFSREEGLAISENLLAKNIIVAQTNRQNANFLDELSSLYSFSEFRHLPRDNSEINLSELSVTPEPEKPKENIYRICLLGNERSGKTTFCQTLVKGAFAEDVKSNNEEVFTKEGVKLSDSETVTIQLMDTGNVLETNFEEKLTKWNEWAHGFILVYSINSKSSFEHIPKLFNTLIKVRNFKMTPITLVATKADCEDERKVSKEESLNLAARYRCPLIEISSKTGQGLNDSVDAMVQSIRKIQFISGPVQHKSGWLKLRVGTQGFKKRFVFLTDSGLRYYSQEPESLSDTTNLKGIIPMQNCVVEILDLPSDAKGGNRRASDPSLLRSTLVASGRRQSQGSDSLESPERERSSSGSSSLPGSPMNKTLTRKNSVSAMSKSAKLKIFITDYNDKNYEILAENEADKEKWFQSLCKVIDKVNTEKQNRSMSDADQQTEKEPLTDEEILIEGIKRFNKSPKKGIQYLVDRNKIEKTETGIVKFLTTNAKVLRKSAIGEYLGDGDPFCANVVVEYLEGFNFEKVSFDDAMRLFLSKFTIPGEAQKIDRIMERFANRFCKCNPGAFETSDVGYILAFSLIMLNTDAHNPNIKPENKMSKEQFVTNNRGINNGKDLPKEYLEALYDKIVQNEIKMEHERDDFTQWDKQGFLYVRDVKDKRGTIHVGSLNKKNVGRKLFCIISSCVLYLFESPIDKKPLNIVPLKNLQIDSLFEDTKETKDSSFSGFTLYCNDPHASIKSAVEGKEVLLKELQFFCEDRKTKMEWMLTFKLNLVSSPY